MNLDEKINRSIQHNLESMAQLFQDADDAGEVLEVLSRIKNLEPLIQDIKTEIKDIQNRLRKGPKPEEKDDKDKREDPSDDPNKYSPSDPDIQDMIKWLPDAKEALDKMKHLLDDPNAKWPEFPGNLPETIDPVTDVLTRLPGLAELNTLYQMYKLYKTVKKHSSDDKAMMKKLIDGQMSVREFVQYLYDTSKEFWEDYLPRMKNDIIDDIIDYLMSEQGIKGVSDQVDDLSSSFQQCCHDMGDTLDGVCNDLTTIKDEVDPRLDLIQLGKLDKVQHAIHSVRGLL